MMLRLIYKDLYLSRKTIIAMVLYPMTVPLMMTAIMIFETSVPTAVDEAAMARMVTLMHLMLGILVYCSVDMVMDTVMKSDENRGWMSFAISSPVTAEGQVREKYLIYVLTVAVMMFCSYACHLFLMASVGNDTTLFGATYMMLLINCMTKAAELPLMFRFGARRGANIRMGAIGLPIFFGMLYGLFGDLSIFGDKEELVNRIFKFLENGTESKPMIALAVLFPYIAGAALYISYRISAKVYVKGAEEHDQ